MRDAVTDILADAGLADDGALVRALESFRTLCPPEAPKPSGALAELLARGSAAAGAVPPSRAASRAAEAAAGKFSAGVAPAVPLHLRKRHRGAAISAAVIAGVGLSASGVAALGGVDYSANPPQVDVRGLAAVPGSAASPSAPAEASGAPDAIVRQAQAFANTAAGGSAGHADPAAATPRAEDDARPGAGVVVPSGSPEQAVESAAASTVESAAADIEDCASGVVREAEAAVSAQTVPRHRADPVPSRGRHVALEAAATARALAGPFTSASFTGAPVKEAVAMAEGVAQQVSSLAGQGLAQEGRRALAALGARH